jgi:hypothetical protein
MPAWQSGPGVINSYSSGAPCGSTGDCRETPDVSALSGPPYYSFYCSAGDCSGIGGWGYFYGTSFATPLWAASVALSNANCANEPPAGFLGPDLYGIAASDPAAFNDITTGNTDFTGTNDGDYPATTGYDLATGLGTPMWTIGTTGSGLASKLCALKIHAPLSVQTAAVATATQGKHYVAMVEATGGTTPYKWSLRSGSLPRGLILTFAGVISGTPSSSGPFSFAVEVTDSTLPPLVATRTFTIHVTASRPTVSTTSLAASTSGKAYRARLKAIGGTAPYKWSISAGALPKGLTLSSAGIISGTPSHPGSFSFRAKVIDSSTPKRQTDSRKFTIRVGKTRG